MKYLLVAGLLFVAGLLAAACGSDDGGGGGADPALDAYATAFLTERAKANGELAYLPPLTLDQDATITDAERDSIKVNYAATIQLSRDFRDRVAAITPPPPVADAHAAYLAALDAQNDYRAQFEDRYGDVQTLQELQDLTAEVLDSDEGHSTDEALTSSCHALRDATGGDDSQILCGDEDPIEQ